MDYDVTLIAGHREGLLARTLESFCRDVFPNFPIRRLIANLDPFMGDSAEGDRCEALIRRHFPDALIFRPDTADFASAVIRAWSATSAPRVLHLEDDWLALEPIGPERIDPLFEPDVGAVTFMCQSKHTRGLYHQTSRRVVKKGRRIVEDFLVNAFSTSPGVFDGDFLREAARRMKPGLDPEKQFFRQINPEPRGPCPAAPLHVPARRDAARADPGHRTRGACGAGAGQGLRERGLDLAAGRGRAL